ncbi:MAG TPA: DinB family protein [Longimicrobium sp.]
MTLMQEAPVRPDYAAMATNRLEGGDPFAVAEATPARLAEAVAGLTPEQLRRPEAPGKWSVLEVVQHLADYDLVNGYRFRMVLAHDTPPIQGYDQDLWAGRLRYRDVPLDAALAQFAALRDANLRLLRTLLPAEWERVGLHAERGPESVRRMFELMAGHDLVHLDQIARIRRATGA